MPAKILNKYNNTCNECTSVIQLIFEIIKQTINLPFRYGAISIYIYRMTSQHCIKKQ